MHMREYLLGLSDRTVNWQPWGNEYNLAGAGSPKPRYLGNGVNYLVC